MSDHCTEKIVYRHCAPDDHVQIIRVLKDWWDGRDLTASVPRLFLDHFCNTSLVAEHGQLLVGFLIGFLSPARANEGYIHFAGVHPGYRGRGIGRNLYDRFFDLCTQNGRHCARACTSPVNKASIAFHQKIGFSVVDSGNRFDGTAAVMDYNRPGDPKVLFKIDL